MFISLLPPFFQKVPKLRTTLFELNLPKLRTSMEPPPEILVIPFILISSLSDLSPLSSLLLLPSHFFPRTSNLFSSLPLDRLVVNYQLSIFNCFVLLSPTLPRLNPHKSRKGADFRNTSTSNTHKSKESSEKNLKLLLPGAEFRKTFKKNPPKVRTSPTFQGFWCGV